MVVCVVVWWCVVVCVVVCVCGGVCSGVVVCGGVCVWWCVCVVVLEGDFSVWKECNRMLVMSQFSFHGEVIVFLV